MVLEKRIGVLWNNSCFPLSHLTFVVETIHTAPLYSSTHKSTTGTLPFSSASFPPFVPETMSHYHCSSVVMLLLIGKLMVMVYGDKSLVKFELFQSDDGKDFHGVLSYNAIINGTFDISRTNDKSFEGNVRLKQPFDAEVSGSILQSDEGVWRLWVTCSPFLDLEGSVSILRNDGMEMSDEKSGNDHQEYPRGWFGIESNSTFDSPLLNFSGRYSLDARRQYDSCPHLTLSHSITTQPKEFLMFASDVWESCDSSDHSYLNLNLSLSSILSPLLTTRLDQVWLFNHTTGHGWESMNATNPLMDIMVNAEWDNLFNHKKRAQFISSQIVDFWIPTFEILYDRNRENMSLSIIREFSSHNDNAVHDEL